MKNFNQTGGYSAIVQAAVAFGSFLGWVGKMVVSIFSYIIRVFGIYIVKFLLFCLVSSIALSFFSFFGVIFTFFAIIILYFKIFQKLRNDDLKFIDAFNKSTQTTTEYLSTRNFAANDHSIANKWLKWTEKKY